MSPPLKPPPLPPLTPSFAPLVTFHNKYFMHIMYKIVKYL